MPPRLAILGLDPIQRHWLVAVQSLADNHEIELTGVADRSLAAAKEAAFLLKPAPPVFDDLREFIKQADPNVILMDRPAHVTIDFLRACAASEIAVFSLGPPVESLAEAQVLAAVLPAQTHLLYTWPRFVDAPASRHCASADDFVRPIRFAEATWMGVNHALAKTFTDNHPGADLPDTPVRSLSVLAWDALGTLIRLMDVPTSVYAAIRGTVPSGNSFSDLSGAAALTLRFPDDAAASLTLSDRAPTIPIADAAPDNRKSPWNRRHLFLWGNGTLHLNSHAYHFRDAESRLIDAGPPAPAASPPAPLPLLDATASPALATLREFIRHYSLPASPHRGWPHQLPEIAATFEALIVSHRTGQPESPERFLHLRR